MENILVHILNIATLSDCLLVIFDNFCIGENVDKGKYIFIQRGRV